MGKKIAAEGKTDFTLNEEQVVLLLKILRKHRMTLPSYLQSMKREVELIDDLMEKLS